MAFQDTIRRLLKRPVLLLLAVGIPAYVAAFFALRPDVEPVTWEAGEIADHLLKGHGFALSRFAGKPQLSANQEPLYPFILANFRQRVPFPYIVILFLQVGVWLWAAGLLGRLAHHWLGVNRALASLGAALWPPVMVYVLSYHPFWLRASALIFVLATLSSYRRMPDFRSAIGVGIALGIAALFRASYLALPLLVGVWMLIPGKVADPEDFEDPELVPAPTPLAFKLGHVALVLLLTAGVLAPWTVRNHRQLGGFVPVTTSGGYTALIGNHPGASGVMDDDAVRRAFSEYPDAFWKKSEVERDRALRRAVGRFWVSRPGEALTLYGKKLAYLWVWRPGIGTRYPGLWTPIYLGLWGVLLPMALVGVWVGRRNPFSEGALLPFSVCVFLSLVYALFAVNMRFRFEYEVLLLPYALVAAGWLRTGWKRR